MGLDDNVVFLSQLGIFRHFALDELKIIAFNAHRRLFFSGKTMFNKNDKSTGCMVIMSGKVHLLHGKKGDDATSQVCGPGEILSEISLIADIYQSEQAIALTDVAILEISRHMFYRILKEYPHRAAMLHRIYASQLHDFITDISKVKDSLSCAPIHE